jgi:hypothetical protein
MPLVRGITVYGLSRRLAKSQGNVTHISVDLLDTDGVVSENGK